MPRIPRYREVEKFKVATDKKILGVVGGPENDGATSFPKFRCFYKVNMYQRANFVDFGHFSDFENRILWR